MEILRDLPALAAWRAALPANVRLGFVPTMGNLHAGHLALVAAARQRCPRVIVSIFVNPLQFNDADDLARYPRTEAEDLAALAAVGVDAVFIPTASAMVPPDAAAVHIAPGALAERWEGAARPGHFAGMATIVAKLFHLVAPSVAVFGQKDFQQLAIVRTMVRSLNFPVDIVGWPTQRAPDGLALSSRNRFLTEAERRQAPMLYRELQDAAAALADAQVVDAVLNGAVARLSDAGFEVDYFVLCAQSTLAPTDATADAVLLAAARLGSVRLIDNLPLNGLCHNLAQIQ